jgi:hypothetical protein
VNGTSVSIAWLLENIVSLNQYFPGSNTANQSFQNTLTRTCYVPLLQFPSRSTTILSQSACYDTIFMAPQIVSISGS